MLHRRNILTAGASQNCDLNDLALFGAIAIRYDLGIVQIATYFTTYVSSNITTHLLTSPSTNINTISVCPRVRPSCHFTFVRGSEAPFRVCNEKKGTWAGE